MSGTMRLAFAVALTVLECTVLSGCGAQTNAGQAGAAPRTVTAAPPSSGVPFATLKELMDSTVDPAADGLWEAVAVTSTSAGVERHEPRTAEEWSGVRRHAITLIEAMNLVVMPGRHAAPSGTQPGPGELPPQEIEHLIEQQRPLFIGFAAGLRETARQALAAIDRKDPEALLKAGSDIDAACEACHVTFWYPNQQYTK